jgi:branched-chain amino acid transport system substrate-binding protein
MYGKRTGVRWATLALAAIVAFGACSSKAKKASTNADVKGPSRPTSAQAAGMPIKVGIICSCSGPLASGFVDAPNVYKAWVNTVNASGGVNGHPIEVFVEDDASVPANSLQGVQSLVQSDHVIAIVDITNLDETWASYVKSVNIPVIGSILSTTPMYSNSDFYHEGQTEDAFFPAVIEAAKSGGATNLGVLYCAEAVQCQEGLGPLRQTARQLGLSVAYAGEIAATAPDYTAQCVAAKQAHINGLFIGDTAVVASKVATNCTQQDYHPVYVIPGASLGSGMLTTPGLKDNLVAPFPNLPYFANTPATQAMNTAVDKYYPGMRQNPTAWTEFASESWPSGLLLQDAVKAGGLTAGGTPSASEIVSGLHSLKGDTLDGLAPELTFAPNQAHPVRCWFTAEIKNGQFGLPLGARTTCAGGSSS